MKEKRNTATKKKEIKSILWLKVRQNNMDNYIADWLALIETLKAIEVIEW